MTRVPLRRRELKTGGASIGILCLMMRELKSDCRQRSLWGQRPQLLRLNNSSQGPPRPPGHLFFLVYYSSWKRA